MKEAVKILLVIQVSLLRNWHQRDKSVLPVSVLWEGIDQVSLTIVEYSQLF